MNKNEAVREFAMCDFESIPMGMVLQGDWYDSWELYGIRDYEDMDADGDTDGGYGFVHVPMWDTAFAPSDVFVERWIDEHREEVAELGFTIIENAEKGLLLLGIDGAGCDFYDMYWEPLYDAIGMQWHDEE